MIVCGISSVLHFISITYSELYFVCGDWTFPRIVLTVVIVVVVIVVVVVDIIVIMQGR